MQTEEKMKEEHELLKSDYFRIEIISHVLLTINYKIVKIRLF